MRPFAQMPPGVFVRGEGWLAQLIVLLSGLKRAVFSLVGGEELWRRVSCKARGRGGLLGKELCSLWVSADLGISSPLIEQQEWLQKSVLLSSSGKQPG